MDRIARRTLLAGAGAAGVAALSRRATAQAGPTRGGTLTVATNDDIKTLDPTFSVQLSERQVLYLVFNTLVAIEQDFSIRPELAKSWTIENDGRRYVFQLQENVKFQDGSPFDAYAAKFNIDRRLDETVASPQRNQLRPVIDTVEAVSPLVLAINLKTPHPGLLADLADRAGFMVSPAAVQKYGPDFGRNPVGTGAFAFKGWTQGTSITLERNPDYWEEGRPYLDRVVFRSIPNIAIGLQRLIVGEVDFVNGIPPDSLRQLEGKPNIATEQTRIGRWYTLQYQVDKPPFDNAKLRSAIAHALDRNRINQITMNGLATLANGPTPAGLWWSSPDEVVYEFDLARAKALLAESGVAPGTAITLSTSSDPIYNRIALLAAEQLRELGLGIVIAQVANSDFYARQLSKAINLSPVYWTQRADPDGLLSILFGSKGFANSTGYSNPKVDALLDSGKRTLDRVERQKVYAEVKKQVMQDLPYIPIYFSADFVATSRKLGGFAGMPDTIPRFRHCWKSA